MGLRIWKRAQRRGIAVLCVERVRRLWVGDLALYEALPRLGSRLTLLLSQCLAAPLGALIEWLWLGTTLTVAQILAGLVILVGVVVALAPKNHVHLTANISSVAQSSACWRPSVRVAAPC